MGLSGENATQLMLQFLCFFPLPSINMSTILQNTHRAHLFQIQHLLKVIFFQWEPPPCVQMCTTVAAAPTPLPISAGVSLRGAVNTCAGYSSHSRTLGLGLKYWCPCIRNRLSIFVFYGAPHVKKYLVTLTA